MIKLPSTKRRKKRQPSDSLAELKTEPLVSREHFHCLVEIVEKPSVSTVNRQSSTVKLFGPTGRMKIDVFFLLFVLVNFTTKKSTSTVNQDRQKNLTVDGSDARFFNDFYYAVKMFTADERLDF